MKTFHESGKTTGLLGGRVPLIARALVTASFAVGFVISSNVAFADPIRVVRSGAVYTGNYDTGFNLAGPDFSFGVSHWLEPVVDCGPCTPGATLDVSTTLIVRDWEAGRATVNGQSFESVFFDGSLTFHAVPITVPSMPPGQSGSDGEGVTRVFPRFALAGTLAGFANPSLTGSPIFSIGLTGDGVARVEFSNYPPESGIRVLQLDYNFYNAAPVPEPGTMLLFASGASWLVLRVRKRRHEVESVSRQSRPRRGGCDFRTE